MGVHMGLWYWKDICSWPKLLNTPTMPLSSYLRNTFGFITYILKLGGVLHYHTKTYNENNTHITL